MSTSLTALDRSSVTGRPDLRKLECNKVVLERLTAETENRSYKIKSLMLPPFVHWRAAQAVLPPNNSDTISLATPNHCYHHPL